MPGYGRAGVLAGGVLGHPLCVLDWWEWPGLEIGVEAALLGFEVAGLVLGPSPYGCALTMGEGKESAEATKLQNW